MHMIRNYFTDIQLIWKFIAGLTNIIFVTQYNLKKVIWLLDLDSIFILACVIEHEADD